MDAEELKGAPDAAAIIDAVTSLAKVEKIGIERGDEESASVLVLPDGKTVKSLKPLLDEYLQAPERREGTATLTQIDSFTAHVNRFKDADSAIFAAVENASDPKLAAVLDYHRATAEGAPRFGRHRAIYRFPVSDEWKAWTSKNNKNSPMTVADFAEFLEDRVADVVDPATLVPDPASKAKPTATYLEASALGLTLASPQGLLDIARGLSIKSSTNVTNAMKVSSGETQVFFQEEHTASTKDGKPMSIPGGFAIEIPVFRGGPPYRLLVRLRYRLQGNVISWFFAISRVEKTWEVAVQEACARAQQATELPLFYGTPES